MNFDLQKFPEITTTRTNSELKNFFFLENGLFRKKSQTTTCLKSRNSAKNGFLYEIILFGLNYHAKRIKHFRRDFYVDLQKSHRILIDENIETPFRTRIYKRRLILFGYDQRSLLNVINLIKSKKPQNSYFGHGAIASNDNFKLKPGKVKQK
ncbi:MAG: hypothetical protein EOP33_06495 [Rickettsiaceae bacterium]|nr:MAG: hypothetical protein EOP33_06495 [Rickettsiaceae bacterium]